MARPGRRPVPRSAALLALAASLGFTACTFRTADVYRPLVLERFPDQDRVEELRREHFPETPEEAFRRSLKLTRTAWDYFDIQVYQSSFAELDFDKLLRAIELVPENPFAWTQLGAYLALQHRPLAAIEATERGIEILDGLDASSGASELQELRTVSLLNLAIYHNTAGRHGDALLALSSIGGLDGLTGFHRLAYHWAAAQAFTGLGEYERSEKALKDGEKISTGDFGASRSRYDYPQYFQPNKRAATFAYLEASNLRGRGRYDEAISKLQSALRGKSKTSFPKLYDARFLLAVTYREVDRLASARNELKALATTAPPKLFRLEAVHHQLALVLIDLDQLGPAEVELRQAVRILRHRNAALDKTLESPPENPAHPILESARANDGWIFSAAYNRLAEAYLDRIRPSRAREEEPPGSSPEVGRPATGFGDPVPVSAGVVHGSDRLIVLKAKELLETALGEVELDISGAAKAPLPGAGAYGDRPRAERNLGRVHWMLGEYEGFLDRYRRALAEAPGDVAALGELLALGSLTPNDDVAQRSYALFLERLPIQAAPLGVNPPLGRLLGARLASQPRASRSEELAHLELRLLLLQGELEAADGMVRAAAERFPRSLWPATGAALVDLALRGDEAGGESTSAPGPAPLDCVPPFTRERGLEVSSTEGPEANDPRGYASYPLGEISLRVPRALLPTPSAAVEDLWEVRDAFFAQAELCRRSGRPAETAAHLRVALALEPGWKVAEDRLEAIQLASISEPLE